MNTPMTEAATLVALWREREHEARQALHEMKGSGSFVVVVLDECGARSVRVLSLDELAKPPLAGVYEHAKHFATDAISPVFAAMRIDEGRLDALHVDDIERESGGARRRC